MNKLPTRAQARQGGLSRSPAKLAAHARAWAARRGIPVHNPGLSKRALQALLARLRAAVTPPDPGFRSIRTLAEHVGVSDRTIRRWLTGVDVPDDGTVRAMRDWLKLVAK